MIDPAGASRTRRLARRRGPDRPVPPCRRTDSSTRSLARPLVLDAAWARGCRSTGWISGPTIRPLEPQRTRKSFAIHRRDIAAGADAVLTNTFGANRCWLARFGRARRRRIDQSAAPSSWPARAAGPRRFVVGSLGPTTAAEEAGAAAEQAAILVEAGVDALLFETYRLRTDRVRARGSRPVAVAAPVPLIVSLWEWPIPPGPTARRLLDAGAAVDRAQLPARGTARRSRSPSGMRPRAALPAARQAGRRARPPDPAMSPAALAAAVPRLLEQQRPLDRRLLRDDRRPRGRGGRLPAYEFTSVSVRHADRSQIVKNRPPGGKTQARAAKSSTPANACATFARADAAAISRCRSTTRRPGTSTTRSAGTSPTARR